MASIEPTPGPHHVSESDLYFIETYLRQRGDHLALLAIDALVLQRDLGDDEKTARLKEAIQGAFHGER